MPCWVVPTLAAELWGVSVETILDGIRDGSIPSRNEGGFVFVAAYQDVASKAARPPTFTVITQQELHALMEEPPPAEGLADEASDEPDTLPESNEPQRDIADWRQIRAATAHRRRPPVAA
jgi:hypothetical protein